MKQVVESVSVVLILQMTKERPGEAVMSFQGYEGQWYGDALANRKAQ